MAEEIKKILEEGGVLIYCISCGGVDARTKNTPSRPHACTSCYSPHIITGTINHWRKWYNVPRSYINVPFRVSVHASPLSVAGQVLRALHD